MLTGKLWPAHPKLLPDELLSSWIVRTAEANGIRLYTLTLSLFGDRHTPWRWDIDRFAPSWLLKEFCQHTGTSYWSAYRATLTVYRGKLYPKLRGSGLLQWILPINTYGLNHQGFGQQICPQCLAEDQIPYFRRKWRIALYTYCPKHSCMLLDACPNCHAPITVHRRDIGHELSESKNLAFCQACGHDFRNSQPNTTEIARNHIRLTRWIDKGLPRHRQFNLGYLLVLHQICKVLCGKPNKGKLIRWVSRYRELTVQLRHIELNHFECQRIGTRHYLLQQALWLLDDFKRLRTAMKAHVVRFNLLTKDLHRTPRWYSHSLENHETHNH